MFSLQKSRPRLISWFSVAMLGIFLFSFWLRFWQLGRINNLVFDEVYYPIFANNYLLGNYVFNAHPPLSQYIIAIGIWLGSHLPFGQEFANSYLGSWRTTFSYRWLNAFTGSFLPLVIGAIAYQLSYRRRYAVIAAFLAALDGLFLVESRFALNNIYLVLFGLLAHLFLLLALKKDTQRRSLYLSLAGLFFGLTAAIKWNGLGFLLGFYLLWAFAWLIHWSKSRRKKYSNSSKDSRPNTIKKNFSTPLTNLTSLKIASLTFYLFLIPLFTYCLSWIPHLIMNPEPGFWQMQREIFTFHQKIGSGPEVHPYCSRWYTWILMLRPVAYFYHTARNTEEMVPAYPSLPSGSGQVIYDVHAMGNPFLWWFAAATMLLLIISLVWRFFRVGLRNYVATPQTWLGLYLAFNYVANLLPWLKVSRCTFLYHYMPSSVFAELALAWVLNRWFSSNYSSRKYAALAVLLIIFLAFLFWLPIYLGLPLSPEGYRMRMWFNWI